MLGTGEGLRCKPVRVAAAAAAASAFAIALILDERKEPVKRARLANIQRYRRTFVQVVRGLSNSEFTSTFRLPTFSIYSLLRLLLPALQRDVGNYSSETTIPPVYLDRCLAFNLGRSTIFEILYATVDAVMQMMPESNSVVMLPFRKYPTGLGVMY